MGKDNMSTTGGMVKELFNSNTIQSGSTNNTGIYLTKEALDNYSGPLTDVTNNNIFNYRLNERAKAIEKEREAEEKASAIQEPYKTKRMPGIGLAKAALYLAMLAAPYYVQREAKAQQASELNNGSLLFKGEQGSPLLVYLNGTGSPTDNISVDMTGKQNIKYILTGNESSDPQTGWAKFSIGGKEYFFPQVAVGGLSGGITYRSVFEVSRNGSDVIPMLRFEAYVNGSSDPVSIATVYPAKMVNSTVVTLERLPGERTDTGYAFVNPDLNNAHNFLLTYYDENGNILDEKAMKLGAGGHIAEFAWQRSDKIGTGFGQVQINSDTDFPAVSLDCKGATLSIKEATEGKMAVGVPTYKFRDMFANGTLDETVIYPVASGQIKLKSTQDGKEYLYNIKDGKTDIFTTDNTYFSLRGEYLLRVDAPGYLAQEQLVEFPNKQEERKLANLKFINPTWFNLTQMPIRGIEGTVSKPTKQSKFYVDKDNMMLDNPLSPFRDVRDVFKQWVFYELPQLRIPVTDDTGKTVFFGGKLDEKGDAIVNDEARGNYFEVTRDKLPPLGSPHTRILQRNDAAQYQVTASSGVDPATFENVMGWIQFRNGSSPQKVAGDFWVMIHWRDDNSEVAGAPSNYTISGMPNATDKLSGYLTQIVGTPTSVSSTPIDRYYWEYMKVRPNGTRILPDKETIPKGK